MTFFFRNQFWGLKSFILEAIICSCWF